MALFRRKKPDPVTVVDLREPDPTAAPAPKVVWGSPVPCPSCRGRGYLDHIDPYREMMFLHCTECMLRYEVTKSEVDAMAASSG